MADSRQLARFTISEAEDGYTIHLEDDAGHKLDLLASEEQLDLVIEELDRVLGEDGADGEFDDYEEDDEEDA